MPRLTEPIVKMGFMRYQADTAPVIVWRGDVSLEVVTWFLNKIQQRNLGWQEQESEPTGASFTHEYQLTPSQWRD